MIRILTLVKENKTVILYGVIGVSAIVVDMVFFLVFFNVFGISPVVSTVFSVTISMVYAFTLNARYNFKTKDLIKTRLSLYALVSLMGLILSASIIKALVEVDINANLAKALSLPPIVVIQYLLNKNITFRQKNEASEELEKITAAKNPKNIAIIGAGFTGLAAAYTLVKLGHKVTIFEAEKEAGGLVSGFEIDGLPLEKAYHFLYKTDKHIIGLANEIGVGGKLHFHSSSVAMAYGGKVYPFMTPLDLLRFTPLSFFNRIRAGVIAVYLSKAKNWQYFASVSAYEWMKKWGGEQVTKIIWEPVLRGKFFSYYDKIAMSYLWSRVYVRANSKDKGDVTEKLGYFEGGFKTFIDALVAKATDRGVNIVYGVKPEAVIQKEQGVEVRLPFDVRRFDACLVTTPSHVFKNLIDQRENNVSEATLSQLSSISYLGAVLMVFTTSKKFTDYYWHNVNDLNQPFLVLLSLSSLVGTEQLNGKNVYYVGSYVPHDHNYFTMSDDEIKTLWLSGIKNIFPDFDANTITNSSIFRFKNAQHIVEPGYAAKIPPYQSELTNVYLANFTQIFPDDRGTNYAVAEGIKVAEMMHRNLGA